MRAVGYFSEGARKGGQKRSIGEQNQAFLDFCARHGYEVAATFLDAEGDGAADGGFGQMLRFLSRADRGFTVVVADGLGTFGADLGAAALKLLEMEGTGVPVLLAPNGTDAFKELVEKPLGLVA